MVQINKGTIVQQENVLIWLIYVVYICIWNTMKRQKKKKNNWGFNCFWMLSVCWSVPFTPSFSRVCAYCFERSSSSVEETFTLAIWTCARNICACSRSFFGNGKIKNDENSIWHMCEHATFALNWANEISLSINFTLQKKQNAHFYRWVIIKEMETILRCDIVIIKGHWGHSLVMQQFIVYVLELKLRRLCLW